MATASELFLVRFNIWLVNGGIITLSAWGKITRGGRYIGLRCPDHEFSRKLIKQCGGALATTSANPSGEKAVTIAKAVDPKILAFSEIMVEGDKTTGGLSSTVAQIKGKKVVVLRKGPIKL